MVSDQMALTAAHCLTKFEKHDYNRTVKLSDGEFYHVKEWRENECWNWYDTNYSF